MNKLLLGAVLLAVPAVANAQNGNAVASAESPRAKRNSNMITAEELREIDAPTALEAVSRLRPAWLRKRGMASLNREGAIRVYQDGMQFGGIGALRQINAAQPESVRFLDGTEATQRYGSDHGNGVILITSHH